MTEQNKQIFDQLSEQRSVNLPIQKRPMSAYSRGTAGSRMTNVPEVGRIRLTIIANDIYKNRSIITEHQKAEQSNLREMLSSSEILQLLRRVGIHLEIGVLKALLKELGFQWNGKACSMMSLFAKISDFITGQEKGAYTNTS